MPTPATSEPGFTVQPVDKNGNPTKNPNERWYHPQTGRLLQKGISQALRENDLLRTPAASEAERGHQPEDKARARGGQVTLSGQFLPTPKARDSQPEGYEAGLRRSQPQVGTIAKAIADGDDRAFLPTPNTMDHLPARNKEDIDFSKGGHRNVRETVVNELLPTTMSSMKGPSKNEIAAGKPKSRLEVEAHIRQTNWGKFEPAIKRWEAVLGRLAPEPTKPDGKDGGHRLSSRFTEWMMGLPKGWITDVGLTRNDELKACGNGVVPLQAELALQILLEATEIE